jgi:hypothetical protein
MTTHALNDSHETNVLPSPAIVQVNDLRKTYSGGVEAVRGIWGMSNVTTEAWLSLGVVAVFAVFAVALVAISVRVFSRSAVG